MSDPDFERKQRFLEAKKRQLNALAKLGVTSAEASLFKVIHYGLTQPPRMLCKSATYREYNIGDQVTARDCRRALANCLAKGWLRLVDEQVLAAIRNELHTGGVIGPVYGMPWLGGVDFTSAGAELWRQVRAAIFVQNQWNGCFEVVHEKAEYYYQTERAALDGIEELEIWKDLMFVNSPRPIGPWRAHWWRKFSNGYRVDVDKRRRWRGCASGGAKQCSAFIATNKSNPASLESILLRRDMALAEWIVLLGIDVGLPTRPATEFSYRTSRYSQEHLALKVGREEILAALDACERKGWIRLIDEASINEIREYIDREPAFMPVPLEEQIRPYGFHFTPVGANLYRDIALEWLGPGWDDSAHAEIGYFWVEHHYGASESMLRLTAENEDVESESRPLRATRLIPVGPWCIYWWERFESGFRLEMEFGDPVRRITE